MCTLYEKIMSLCEQKGVSGSKACLDIGISKSTLSDIKAGRKKSMHPDTLQKFANYFNVSVDSLLCRDSCNSFDGQDSSALSPTKKKLVELVDALPEEKIHLAERLLQSLLAE